MLPSAILFLFLVIGTKPTKCQDNTESIVAATATIFNDLATTVKPAVETFTNPWDAEKDVGLKDFIQTNRTLDENVTTRNHIYVEEVLSTRGTEGNTTITPDKSRSANVEKEISFNDEFNGYVYGDGWKTKEGSLSDYIYSDEISRNEEVSTEKVTLSEEITDKDSEETSNSNRETKEGNLFESSSQKIEDQREKGTSNSVGETKENIPSNESLRNEGIPLHKIKSSQKIEKTSDFNSRTKERSRYNLLSYIYRNEPSRDEQISTLSQDIQGQDAEDLTTEFHDLTTYRPSPSKNEVYLGDEPPSNPDVFSESNLTTESIRSSREIEEASTFPTNGPSSFTQTPTTILQGRPNDEFEEVSSSSWFDPNQDRFPLTTTGSAPILFEIEPSQNNFESVSRSAKIKDLSSIQEKQTRIETFEESSTWSFDHISQNTNPVATTIFPFPFEVEESIITIPSVLMEQINPNRPLGVPDFNEESLNEDILPRLETVDYQPENFVLITTSEANEDLAVTEKIPNLESNEDHTEVGPLITTATSKNRPVTNEKPQLETNEYHSEIPDTITTSEHFSATYPPVNATERNEDIVVTDKPSGFETTEYQTAIATKTNDDQKTIKYDDEILPSPVTTETVHLVVKEGPKSETIERLQAIPSSLILTESNEGVSATNQTIEFYHTILPTTNEYAPTTENIFPITITTETSEDTSATKTITDSEIFEDQFEETQFTTIYPKPSLVSDEFQSTTSKFFERLVSGPSIGNQNGIPEDVTTEKLTEEESTTFPSQEYDGTTLRNHITEAFEEKFGNNYEENSLETTTTIIDVWLAEENMTKTSSILTTDTFEQSTYLQEQLSTINPEIVIEEDHVSRTKDFEAVTGRIHFSRFVEETTSANVASSGSEEMLSYRKQKQLKTDQDLSGVEEFVLTTASPDLTTPEVETPPSFGPLEDNITSTIFSKELVDNGQFTADAINILKEDNYETTENVISGENNENFTTENWMKYEDMLLTTTEETVNIGNVIEMNEEIENAKDVLATEENSEEGDDKNSLGARNEEKIEETTSKSEGKLQFSEMLTASSEETTTEESNNFSTTEIGNLQIEENFLESEEQSTLSAENEENLELIDDIEEEIAKHKEVIDATIKETDVDQSADEKLLSLSTTISNEEERSTVTVIDKENTTKIFGGREEIPKNGQISIEHSQVKTEEVEETVVVTTNTDVNGAETKFIEEFEFDEENEEITTRMSSTKEEISINKEIRTESVLQVGNKEKKAEIDEEYTTANVISEETIKEEEIENEAIREIKDENEYGTKRETQSKLNEDSSATINAINEETTTQMISSEESVLIEEEDVEQVEDKDVKGSEAKGDESTTINSRNEESTTQMFTGEDEQVINQELGEEDINQTVEQVEDNDKGENETLLDEESTTVNRGHVEKTTQMYRGEENESIIEEIDGERYTTVQTASNEEQPDGEEGSNKNTLSNEDEDITKESHEEDNEEDTSIGISEVEDEEVPIKNEDVDEESNRIESDDIVEEIPDREEETSSTNEAKTKSIEENLIFNISRNKEERESKEVDEKAGYLSVPIFKNKELDERDDIPTMDTIISSIKELEDLDNHLINRTSTISSFTSTMSSATEESAHLITQSKINIPLIDRESFSKHVFKTYIDKTTTEGAIPRLSTSNSLVDLLRGQDSNRVEHLLTDRDTRLNFTSEDVRDWQKISLNGLAEVDEDSEKMKVPEGDLHFGGKGPENDSFITHFYDEDYHSEDFNSTVSSTFFGGVGDVAYVLVIPENDAEICLKGNLSLRILIGEHVINLPNDSQVFSNSTNQSYNVMVIWKEEVFEHGNNSVYVRISMDDQNYFIQFVEVIHAVGVDVMESRKDDLGLLTTKLEDDMVGSAVIDFENGYQLELVDVSLRLRNISNHEDLERAAQENPAISRMMLVAICSSSLSCLLLLVASAILYKKWTTKTSVYKMTIE